jgi:hypothetical protein
VSGLNWHAFDSRQAFGTNAAHPLVDAVGVTFTVVVAVDTAMVVVRVFGVVVSVVGTMVVALTFR